MKQEETNMGAALVRDLVNKLASTLQSLRQPAEFVCGDCERWARCGMPSSDNCIFKAEQIARGDWQMKRLSKALSLAMGGPMPLDRSKMPSIVDHEICIIRSTARR
jgi:hypothetical protein